MIKIPLVILLLLILSITNVSALLDVNVTNVISEGLEPNKIGGDDVITPHQHYWDSYFCIYNDGNIPYQIYQYDYIGDHPDKYKNAFIGSINPDQMIMLNNNASYRVYASYNKIQDITDVETVKKRFNQWWLVIVVIGIVLLFAIKIYKVIR